MVEATELRAEHRTSALGVGTATPRLSWITRTDERDWRQVAYELEVDGVAQGRVESDESVLVDWPAEPLRSRQHVEVRVRVRGGDGSESDWSEPLTIEAGLLEPSDWTASWITPADGSPIDATGPAHHLRCAFTVTPPDGAHLERARLYVTSAGVHQVELNGAAVGDRVLAPGWSTYPAQLRYDTHDVTALVADGENVLGAVVADGWWRGRLGWYGRRNVYGDRVGLLAQLELTFSDGRTETVGTDERWRAATGPVVAADLYDGETFDARRALDGWSSPGFDDGTWSAVERFEPDVGALVAPPGPPVRRTETLAVAHVLTSPSGKTVLDFGQNLVGRVRFTVEGPAGTTVTLRHAEVLEDGELATAPLRSAQATDRYTLRGDGPETWEPAFTFHGFRYVEVDGWPGALDPSAFAAVVLHSDLERTGRFHCSHDLLNRLHLNVVWGMRGNFLDVPTDCPQRDERLGWTGDIQVFTPTASYLFDVAGFLESWLADLRAEQGDEGGVPSVIPNVPGLDLPDAAAGWSDVATVVPWELYRRFGDRRILETQLASMRRWVDHVAALAGDDHLWDDDGFQYGDWLDPLAPEDAPWEARTDRHLVATAYFARSAQIVSDAAAALGDHDLAERYARLAADVRRAFRDEYVTPNGRMVSDSATAYALALRFGLVDDEQVRVRLARNLARVCGDHGYTITTGFLGTPVVLAALTDGGRAHTAYRLLTQTACPSWLYPVTMGATTVWERWDSMLPDGRVNGTFMTSFNHYALGSVADWMHETIGALAPAAPGWKHIRVAPVPGRGVDGAEASFRSPYGTTSCRWSVEGRTVHLAVEVPPNTGATVVRPGLDEPPVDVGSGTHEWTYDVTDEVAAGWRDQPG